MNEIKKVLKSVKKPFRVKGKAIFLTYSKINYGFDIKDVRNWFSDRLIKCLSELKARTLSGVAVALEMHKDGSYHIHAFMDFSSTFETENPRYFDIDGMHPNFAKAKNRENALSYLLKEDKKVHLDEHTKTLCVRWNSTARYMVEHYLAKGFGPDLTAVKMGNYGYNNVSKIKRWWQASQAALFRKNQIEKKGFALIIDRLISNKEMIDEKEKPIFDALFDSIKTANEYKGKRPLKTKNLLFYSSKPSVGKTTLCQVLEENVKVFDFPTDGWWDGYEDCFYDLIVWNEVNFVGWQITDINRLFEGTSLKLPIKGSKQTKTDNPLIICTSNLNLEGLLKQKGYSQEKVDFYLPILRTRIKEVSVEQGLWGVIKAIKGE